MARKTCVHELLGLTSSGCHLRPVSRRSRRCAHRGQMTPTSRLSTICGNARLAATTTMAFCPRTAVATAIATREMPRKSGSSSVDPQIPPMGYGERAAVSLTGSDRVKARLMPCSAWAAFSGDRFQPRLLAGACARARRGARCRVGLRV